MLAKCHPVSAGNECLCVVEEGALEVVVHVPSWEEGLGKGDHGEAVQERLERSCVEGQIEVVVGQVQLGENTNNMVLCIHHSERILCIHRWSET